MNTSQQQTRRAFTASHHTSDRPQPGQTAQPEARKFRSAEEMEELDSIKMQHAAALFVIEFLQQRKSGWYARETIVGSREDFEGTDLHLLNDELGMDIPVDFSTSSKGGFAVKLEREWFKKEGDKLVFLANNASVLFSRFAPAMNPNNRWDLLGWKLAQRKA